MNNLNTANTMNTTNTMNENNKENTEKCEEMMHKYADFSSEYVPVNSTKKDLKDLQETLKISEEKYPEDVPGILTEIQECENAIHHYEKMCPTFRQKIHQYICECPNEGKEDDVCECENCECYTGPLNYEQHMKIPDRVYNQNTCKICLGEHYISLLLSLHGLSNNATCYLGGYVPVNSNKEYIPLCEKCVNVMTDPRILKMAEKLNAVFSVSDEDLPYLYGYEPSRDSIWEREFIPERRYLKINTNAKNRPPNCTCPCMCK